MTELLWDTIVLVKKNDTHLSAVEESKHRAELGGGKVLGQGEIEVVGVD